MIRTRDIDSQELEVSEFVPVNKLQGEVPNIMLTGTVLRFHVSSLCLQVYQASSGWDPSSLPTWTLRFTADPLAAQSSPKITGTTLKGVEYAMLSPESPLVHTLFGPFQPLEACVADLLVIWEPVLHEISSKPPPYHSGILRVSLPNYNLNFFLNTEGDLECKDFPGLFVSRTQSISTLFGLQSKLVLDPKDENTSRRVIIPQGEITVSRNPELPDLHTQVTIMPYEDVGKQIKMFIYEVDELIGRLVGDGTMTSWYLLAYLHILTSSHLRDPLTHRTGVHQALVMLKAANSFSFIELTTEDVGLLRSIHNLTPVRRYYPRHLTSMEQVDWDQTLSPLSQSELFAPLVESIFSFRNNQALFQPASAKLITEYKGDSALRERSEYRNSRLVSSEVHEAQSIDGKPKLCEGINLSHEGNLRSPIFLGSLLGNVRYGVSSERTHRGQDGIARRCMDPSAWSFTQTLGTISNLGKVHNSSHQNPL